MHKNAFWVLSILTLSLFGFLSEGRSAASGKNNRPVKIDHSTFEKQIPETVARILANVNHPLIAPGAIIASPSRDNPNYFFHWSRDAALSVRVFTDVLSGKSTLFTKEQAERILWTWVRFESSLQTLPAPAGLGEPKFNVDGSIFDGPWGRPQNDGPALRAVTLIRFANYLLSENRAMEVQNYLLPIIQNDLEYTSNHWREASFDLWEEIKGDHFYTRLAQWKALDLGSRFLNKFAATKKQASRYAQVSTDLAQALRAHFNEAQGIIYPTLNQVDGWTHKHSHLDVAVILAYLHSTEPGDLFSPKTPLVRLYLHKLIAGFSFYEINHQYPELGFAIGRYPEDVYDGNGFGNGHPWFLATFAVAEYKCRIGESPDAFFARGLFHAGSDGAMQEQYSRFNGFMKGASDLTWSHVSFLSALTVCGKSGSHR